MRVKPLRRYRYSWTTVMLPQNGSPPQRATGILPLPVAHFFDEPPECGVPHEVSILFFRYVLQDALLASLLVRGSPTECSGRASFPAIKWKEAKSSESFSELFSWFSRSPQTALRPAVEFPAVPRHPRETWEMRYRRSPIRPHRKPSSPAGFQIANSQPNHKLSAICRLHPAGTVCAPIGW